MKLTELQRKQGGDKRYSRAKKIDANMVSENKDDIPPNPKTKSK